MSLMSILNVNADAMKAAAQEATEVATALHDAVMANWEKMVPTQPAAMDQASVLAMENCNNFSNEAKVAIASMITELGMYAKVLLEAANSYSDAELRNAFSFSENGGGPSGQ